MQKDNAREIIAELVTRFAEQIDSYKHSDYNETQTRRDFIDPFFKALGWDIDNQNGYAEAYREVIHEDKIKISGATKAPDYSFRLAGGKRLFFVEAKKPSVAVKDDILPAYQIRRYGWSAKHPISIITDFEEFAIYDCTQKPNPNDKASVARIKYFTYEDYLNEFDFLWETFSKERVLKGSFDKYVLNDTNKKGTTTVDKEFLSSLDKWRTDLAVNISKQNLQLNEDELNFVVQQTIDRIIFLRIAEDRHIEPYGTLQNSVKQGGYFKNIYDIFRQADEKYNSGLFDLTKDKISKTLVVENKILKKIINELYYPESPYEFSVLSVEILGSAYEQFLGKTILIDKSHRAKIEEKPEVRKAGGVYYTPQYIVDYIVKNTVGHLIEGKTPKEIDKIKIADPACGSGSFLIGAYQYLLDYHKNYYTENGTKIGKKDSPITPEGSLTSNEKKRILLNNIYGVDIDTNAVEVTKLSLLLKCMEGETETTIAQQYKLWQERILPTLDDNIKSGNSLIDTDFYDTKLDFGEDRKIKPFNWQNAFPNVFAKGGFDVVIGNPPYVNIVAIDEEQRKYFQKKYEICRNKVDLYSLFIEQSTKLVNEKSKISVIIPHTWLATDSFVLLRKLLLEKKYIEQIVELGFGVFQKVVVSTVILMCSPENKKVAVYNKDFSLRSIINPNFWIDDNFTIDLTWSQTKDKLYSKISKAGIIPLEKILQFSRGIKTSNDNRFILTERKNNDCKKVFRGRNIKAYQLTWNGEYVWYRPDLMKEKVGCLPHSKEFFEVPEKIITQRVNSSMQLLVAYDDKQNYFLDTTTVSRYDTWDRSYSMKYLCGCLNSKLLNYWYCNKYKMPTIGLYELHSIPIKTIDKLNKFEYNYYQVIIRNVDALIQLNKDIQSATLQTQIDQIQSRIDYHENKINIAVYQLYSLTKDEIKIVEDSIKK